MSQLGESLKSSLEELHSLAGAILADDARTSPQNLYNDLTQLTGMLRDILTQADDLTHEIRACWTSRSETRPGRSP